jgi:enoyl-CoA hydratase/carnithine racemase
MNNPLVRVEVAEQIAILTLNHPEKRNALSRALLENLKEHLTRIAVDRDVHVVILRAEGAVFSSGHDLRELVGGDRDQYTSLFALCTDVMEAIRKLPQPVIAQVQGLATAAGCQLVASCDLVVASEQAAFATPGVKIGLFCTTPAVALCRAVVPKKAMEMLLTGSPISARDAERVGLVNRVVPADQLAQETRQLAKQISAASAAVVALGKKAFYEQLPLDRPAAYAAAQKVMVENALAPQAREGIGAFLEKRAPSWSVQLDAGTER